MLRGLILAGAVLIATSVILESSGSVRRARDLRAQTPTSRVAHHEFPNDPWIPSPGKITTRHPSRRQPVARDGHVSIQVNVDLKGRNILGDAANEIPDRDDIAAGISLDCNANDVPDECEYRADFDGDSLTTLRDLAAHQRCFTGDQGTITDPCCRLFDITENNRVDLEDLPAIHRVLSGP